MVATDMYGKSPYGSGYTELRESVTFLPPFFSFLIINFCNLSYIFTLHHCSAICWDFILRLIPLDMCVMFLFVSVIIVFVYDCWHVWKGAFYLFMITIYWFQSLLFCNRGICLVCFRSPISMSFLYFFSVNNIIVSSEISFS